MKCVQVYSMCVNNVHIGGGGKSRMLSQECGNLSTWSSYSVVSVLFFNVYICIYALYIIHYNVCTNVKCAQRINVHISGGKSRMLSTWSSLSVKVYTCKVVGRVERWQDRGYLSW